MLIHIKFSRRLGEDNAVFTWDHVTSFSVISSVILSGDNFGSWMFVLWELNESRRYVKIDLVVIMGALLLSWILLIRECQYNIRLQPFSLPSYHCSAVINSVICFIDDIDKQTTTRSCNVKFIDEHLCLFYIRVF